MITVIVSFIIAGVFLYIMVGNVIAIGYMRNTRTKKKHKTVKYYIVIVLFWLVGVYFLLSDHEEFKKRRKSQPL